MNKELLDVIVVGGGYAALSTSYYLSNHGLNHVVFEKGKIGESWRSQRWTSFKLNTPNKLNTLPGMTYDDVDPDGFAMATEYVSSFEDFVAQHHLPVFENSKVISIEKTGELFHVTVSSNDIIKNYSSRQVVIASGTANEIKIPFFTKKISGDINQLHTSEYRGPDQLPDGAILVVGSGQSGCQIAEDLADAGKRVFLSTSMVARIPRWYRGKDCFDWLIDMKFFDMKAEQIEDPAMLQMRAPQLTGTGNGRTTLSLQSLAKKGIMILGKTENADKENVFFQPSAAIHVKFADGFSKKVKEMIDAFILKNNLPSPAPEFDPDDLPDENASCANPLASINFREENISSIIWSTGFNADISYIKLPVFDDKSNLKHENGIPYVPGLYFVGIPWLRARKSTIIFGIKDDAEFVAQKAYHYAHQKLHANSIQ